MKKLLTLAALIFASFTLSAQNVTKDAQGNYVAVKSVKEAAKATGKTYTDSKGVVYPVMQSASGKLFVIRTSKSGNEYRTYLKVN